MKPNGGAIERFVRGLEGDYFLQREAAAALGCSTGLLAKLRDEDHELLGPSFAADYRETAILLYTAEDVARIKAHLETRNDHFAVDATADHPGRPGKSLNRMGRPALFTAEEVLERQNRHSKAGYWKARAVKHRNKHEPEKALRAQARADAIRAQLHAEHVARAAGQDVIAPEVPEYQLVVGG